MIDESNAQSDSSTTAEGHPSDDAAAQLVSAETQSPAEEEAVSGDVAEANEEASTEVDSEGTQSSNDDSDDGEVLPLETSDEAEEERSPRDWYILKVQSNREDSIREALLRRVKIEGLDDFFGEVIVPTEMVTEFKNGKKRVVKRKLYPGYIVVHMEINDDTWFLVRDTPGIGDFTGAGGRPVPMLAHEVNRLLKSEEEEVAETPKLKIAFKVGERVKISEGNFENFEGDVDSIDDHNGKVTVMINIFGRSTPVELEYWQLEAV